MDNKAESHGQGYIDHFTNNNLLGVINCEPNALLNYWCSILMNINIIMFYLFCKVNKIFSVLDSCGCNTHL